MLLQNINQLQSTSYNQPVTINQLQSTSYNQPCAIKTKTNQFINERRFIGLWLHGRLFHCWKGYACLWLLFKYSIILQFA